ncbi:class I SAM-dependent methyltransferase, partial [Mycobacterium tuberculosis]|nr:class I SAM-dependent methyltransferase [Mycobacterium tuberculosis]
GLKGLPKFCQVLDYGAGRGDLLRLISSHFPSADLVGVDFFDRPEDLAHQIGWMKADLNETIDLPHDFDVVICTEVIEHLE